MSDRARGTKPRAMQCEVLAGLRLWGFDARKVRRYRYVATIAWPDDCVLAPAGIFFCTEGDQIADRNA